MNKKLTWLSSMAWLCAGVVFGCFICSLFVDETTRWKMLIVQFSFVAIELVIALLVVRIARK